MHQGKAILITILKIILFPLLIMVNPKIYFPYKGASEDEDDSSAAKPSADR